jgi:uncharacterized lipoprotein YddW (UPF0748 family)
MPVLATLVLAAGASLAPELCTEDEKIQGTSRPRFEIAAPLPGLRGVMIDSFLNGYGIANQTARAQGLQARILWVDCTANIDRYNTEEKIVSLMQKARDVGFNTVVLDVKPISGQVIYQSQYAPRLAEWRGKTLPADFEPVPVFLREARKQGLGIYASLNAFSEGHRLFTVGPGYAKKEQQTVLYETEGVVRSYNGETFRTSAKIDSFDAERVSVLTSFNRVPSTVNEGFAFLIRPNGRILDGYYYQANGPKVTVPKGALVVFGTGPAANFLEQAALPGQILKFDTNPLFVPISERPEQQYPLMMNINHPEVQSYALNIVNEVVRNFAFDGIIYDDRLRYGGLNADFSPESRALFEKQVGKPLQWPDDVFKFVLNPNLNRGMAPGPYYDEWISFRAARLRSFVQTVRTEIQRTRPGTQLGVYAGSWYGEYPNIGNNWASDEVDAGFWFSTPGYRRTGFARDLDFLITGCYYTIGTIHDAMSQGANAGTTVEAAGALSNRLVADDTWTYAGIALQNLQGDIDKLEQILQASCASTQGVMVFDLSHDIDQFWPTFAKAFSQPRVPPHAVRGLIDDVRRRRAAVRASGKADPPVIILSGAAGIGQN